MHLAHAAGSPTSMGRRVPAIVTVIAVRFPDRVEVQALLLYSDDSLTGIREIYALESWHLWITRFQMSEVELNDAEFTLARGEAAQLGPLVMSLPIDLFGREFVLQPS